jgi:hypothetical protein
MLATAPERTMRAVRAVLATGFVLLIAALIANPAVLGRVPGVATQGPLGPAGFLWWTLTVPLIPVFLLVFGHEAWRRVCPLSALSQIPRSLGLSTQKKRELDRDTGTIKQKLRLIPGASWLARNASGVQFALLVAAVMLRVALLNQSRLALGLFLAGVVVTAFCVGLVFGGKTWCNTFCPISPVQKFYTGPRGLLESRSHLALKVITGSMCRTHDAGGREVSACVGCRSPCPDVDLERSYWAELQSPARALATFGYAGLVAGYVSIMLYGVTLPGPRFAAAPATLLLFVLGGWVLGLVLLERWTVLRKRPEALARHELFAVTTFFTFNAFYLLGGRALFGLFPELVRAGLQFGVVVASSLWLVQALARSAERYERESLGGNLRKQLHKLNFDSSKVLGGRTLDDLEADEVYLLARALPELSKNQLRATYKETLRESITSGSATTPAGAGVLRDLRAQLSISEEEHGEVLTELGVEDGRLLEPEQLQSHEQRLRLESYKTALEGLVLELVNQGQSVQEALQKESVREQIRTLQQLYEVRPEDQERATAGLMGAGGRLSREMQELIARLGELGARGRALASVQEESAESLVRLLLMLMAQRRRQLVQRALGLLSASGPTTEAAEAAERLARLAPDDLAATMSATLDQGFMDWSRALSPGILAVLQHTQGAVESAPQAQKGPVAALMAILHEPEPIARAAALQALALLEPELPGAVAAELLEQRDQHWLVKEAARALAAGEKGTLPVLERMLRLSEAPLFKVLQPEVLANLAREAGTRKLRKGEALCEQGAPSNELLLLWRGGADVEVLQGGRVVVVNKVGPGAVIGELGVLARTERTATVRATSDGTEVLTVPAERVDALLQDGRVATGLLRTVSQRLAQTLGQLAAKA